MCTCWYYIMVSCSSVVNMQEKRKGQYTHIQIWKVEILKTAELKPTINITIIKFSRCS